MDINSVFSQWKQNAKEFQDLVKELDGLDPVQNAKDIYERF